MMWQKMGAVCILMAAAALVGALVARIVLAPFPLVLEARHFFQAADTLLEFVIAISLMKIAAALSDQRSHKGE